VNQFGQGDQMEETVEKSPDLTSDVVEHFDRLSRSGDWSRLYAVADGSSYHFHVRRTRVLELLPQRLGRVVDLGCGPGVMVEAVLERGGTFEGIDLSPEMVREARERFGLRQGVSFKEGNVEAPDLPSETYNQVICMAVIEYLNTPDRALSEIARILRPGGIALITVPKEFHIDHVTTSIAAPIRYLAHKMGVAQSDHLPRLCLQPGALDAAAIRAGLVPDGGAQYHFTPLPYPLTRLAPGVCMRLNVPFERWHSTRAIVRSFFAHGFVGRYRKPA
jgi:ubiquinone/menaquinone biosynthesis C-methylase UbiE